MVEIKDSTGDFPFIILLGLLLLIGIAQQLEGNRIALFLRSFFNGNLADQQLRQERAFSRLALLAFSFVLMTIAAFSTPVMQNLGYLSDFSNLSLFITIFIILFFLTTARVALYTFTSWLFEIDSLQQQHNYHWLLTNVIGCILLIPIIAFIEFGPRLLVDYFMYSGVSILAAINGFRLLRIMYISNTVYAIKITYYFLYICTLEVIPVAISITVVLRQIGG